MHGSTEGGLGYRVILRGSVALDAVVVGTGALDTLVLRLDAHAVRAGLDLRVTCYVTWYCPTVTVLGGRSRCRLRASQTSSAKRC